MKAIFLFLLTAIVQPLFAQKQVVVDPNAQVRRLEGTFNSISVSGGVEVFISQSPDVAMAVSSSREKDIDQIETIIEKGELRVGMKDKGLRLGKNKFRVYVSAPRLEHIKVTSASDLVIAGTWKQENLVIKVSSASDLTGDIDVTNLILDISGASDVMLTGKAVNAVMDASGASDIMSPGLVVSSATIEASGASDIQLTVNGDLSAEASGSSHISYKGDAKVLTSNTSGASRIGRNK